MVLINTSVIWWLKAVNACVCLTPPTNPSDSARAYDTDGCYNCSDLPRKLMDNKLNKKMNKWKRKKKVSFFEMWKHVFYKDVISNHCFVCFSFCFDWLWKIPHFKTMVFQQIEWRKINLAITTLKDLPRPRYTSLKSRIHLVIRFIFKAYTLAYG